MKTLYQSHNNDFIPVSNLQIFRGFLEKCFCFNKYIIRQATKAYKTVNTARNCAQALIQLD